MRKAVAALVLAAVLVPGRADAKEGIERLRVCGASACRTITDERLLTPLIAGLLGTEAQPAPPPGRFFTLVPEATVGWPHTWPRFLYASEARLVRQADGRGRADWYPLMWTAGAYERATDGLEPFPEPISWSELWTPAPQHESRDRLRIAIGGAVALVVLAGAGIGVLRRRQRVRPD